MDPIIPAEVQRWISTIGAYDKEFAEWEKRAKRVLDRYTDRKAQQRKTAKFNVLWSNVQTLVPACFSRLPKPSVSRRYKDNDPVGRVAALMLERALEFEIEHYGDYRSAMRQVVQDRFLGGRGTAWIRYEPHMQSDGATPEDGAQITEDIDEAPGEVIEYECAPVDYVHWRDFGHTVARTWEEVTAVWRKVYMTKAALEERFPDFADRIPLDTKPEDLKKLGQNDNNQTEALALIYEIWDKSTGKALWMSKSLGEFVDERPDPLGLEEFWPCPRPLYSTITTDSLVPTPDLVFYQDQADACDTLAERITGLIDALKVRGVYDAATPELARLFSEGGNNDLIPVKNWNAFSEKMGLKGAIDIVDLKPIADALQIAYGAFTGQLDQIYQITGIADIIRGDTDANETLGAQEIKGQFATLRIRDSQKDVAHFATEVLRIKAQIICSKFTPESIVEIGAADQLSETDKQIVPQAMALLKQATARTFRIEVEADSLVQLDENMEKQQRVEFLGAVGAYLEKAIQAIQVAPQAAPLLVQLLKFGVVGFKVGKQIEGDIDSAIDQMKQAAANPQPPPPDPEMVKVQGQMQLQQAKDQSAAQLKQLEMQFSDQQAERQAQRDMQVEQWKQQMQSADAQHQNELEAQRQALEVQHQAMLEESKRQHEATMEAMRLEFERWKVTVDNETKLAVAQIGADSKAASATGIEATPVDLSPLQSMIQALADQLNAPAEILRGPDGRATGVRRGKMTKSIMRGPDGRATGVQ